MYMFYFSVNTIEMASQNLTGYPQNVTNELTSGKGRAYYKATMQTSVDQSSEIIIFSPPKAKKLKMMAERKSPAKVRRMIDFHGTPAVNELSFVSEAKACDISFPFAEMTKQGEKEEEMTITQMRDGGVDVKRLKLKGYVIIPENAQTSVWVPNKNRSIKLVKGTISDEGGKMKISIWEGKIDLFESNHAYTISGLTYKARFDNVATTYETTVEPTELPEDFELPEDEENTTDDDTKRLVLVRFIGVTQLELVKICVRCNQENPYVGTALNVKCSRCDTKSPADILETGVSCTVSFKQDDDIVDKAMNSKVIKEVLSHESVAEINVDTVEDALLAVRNATVTFNGDEILSIKWE